MSFTYNTAVPASGNNPSNDQPDMLTNTQSIDGILDVDHVTFNAANGGTHRQSHYVLFTNPSAISNTGTQGSVVYGAAGVADATRAQLYFKNDHQQQIPLTVIKAFGIFDGAGTLLNGMNVSVGSHVVSSGIYVMDVPVNILASNNYLVIVDSTSSISTYSIISSSQFQLSFSSVFAPEDPTSFSVLVLQI